MPTKKKVIGHQYEHRFLPLDELTIHPLIQRRFVPSWGSQIAREFDPDLFGALLVNAVEKYEVFDGQHRVYAARQALGKGQLVPCLVYKIDEIEELARIARAHNRQKAWKSIDDFKLRIHERDWVALSIHGVLHHLGLRIDYAAGPGVVRAVAACDWVFKKLGQHGFEDCISRLHAAWGDDPDAYNATLIRGLGSLYARYDGEIEPSSLVTRLAKSGGPARMIGRARDMGKVSGMTQTEAAAEVMRVEYNRGRSTKRLAPTA